MINKLKFNKELHFLRSLSILLVVFFHFDLLNFNGGYVGVDIFFVISGYLITSIILQDNNFKFTSFYFKRLKRIYPLILFIIIFSLILANFILSPIHYERLINSSQYTAFGLSNLFFFYESGYFDQEKLFKPLLHTWSLSVELQFYLIWPVIIYFVNKFFYKKLLIIILLLFIISLSLSFLYSNRTDAFFYFTGFRIYEFCIGTIAYLILNKKKIKPNTSLFYFGLVLIFISSIYFNENSNFPGAIALVPCIGAFLIIIFKLPKSNNLKIFENKFINLTGNISYTIYIVHWPILIFYTYHFMRFPDNLEKISLIFIIFLFSIFLNKYYETPLRYGKVKSKFQLSNLYLFAIFFSCILTIQFSKENIQKPLQNNFYENEVIKTVFDGRDLKNRIEDAIYEKNMKINPADIKKDSINIVIGDSHALDFYLALTTLNQTEKFKYYDFDYFYCFNKKNFKDKIINTLNYKVLKRKNSCEIALKELNMSYISKAKNLIISSRWSRDVDFTQISNYFNVSNQNKIIIINGHKFYDIPTLYFKTKSNVNNFAKNLLKQNYISLEKLNFSEKKDLKFFDKTPLNCNPKCLVFKDGYLLYSDKDHWSMKSMKYFGEQIKANNFFKLVK